MLPKAAKTATEAEEVAVAVVEEDIVIIIVEDTTTIGEVIVDMATTAEVDTKMEEDTAEEEDITIITVIADMTGNRVAMRILEDATDEIQTGGLLNKRTLEKLPQRKQQPDPN